MLLNFCILVEINYIILRHLSLSSKQLYHPYIYIDPYVYIALREWYICGKNLEFHRYRRQIIDPKPNSIFTNHIRKFTSLSKYEIYKI